MNVPHDWSIEGPFDEKNPTGGAGRFFRPESAGIANISRFRRIFAQRRVFIDFDGVMANSDVWINGVHLGKRPYGYVSFRYELTGHLQFGAKADNVIAVRADNSAEPASRWYAGAGIYRHVRLLATDPVHIDHWATFVSTPKVSAESATVKVQSAVVNQSEAARTVAVQFMIVDPQGKAIGSRQDESRRRSSRERPPPSTQTLEVNSPELWSLGHPALYRIVTSVIEGEHALDLDSTRFGIRDAHFEAATGFWLNGKNFKIKGACLHHEAGGLGTAVPDRAWERRIAALKELGVNAIRTAHNPPSPDFLDICDRMGVLVMDEMFDCLGRRQESLRLPSLLPRMVEDRHARHGEARPQSSQRHPL